MSMQGHFLTYSSIKIKYLWMDSDGAVIVVLDGGATLVHEGTVGRRGEKGGDPGTARPEIIIT